jgi:hypothetical protein
MRIRVSGNLAAEHFYRHSGHRRNLAKALACGAPRRRYASLEAADYLAACDLHPGNLEDMSDLDLCGSFRVIPSASPRLSVRVLSRAARWVLAIVESERVRS